MLETIQDKIKASATSQELISITLKSRRMIEVATSKEFTMQTGEVATSKELTIQKGEVATLASGRDINYKGKKSRRPIEVATSKQFTMQTGEVATSD